MNAEQFQKAHELFDLLVEVPRAQRDDSLDAHCGSDRTLRAFVKNLLSCHDRGVEGFLSQPALDTTSFCPAQDDMAGAGGVPQRIGRYEIVRVIAEGGMGTVYEARQEHPNRRVALKVIRPGFASPTMLRRFQYEAEVLGRLHHPGIAQIYEAGIAEVSGEWLVVSGGGARGAPTTQPFFAMEFVEGLPLTDYARQHDLNVEQRLALVARVCDAVQHAHQKGVIHRDLKPANILVAEGTGGPRDRGTKGVGTHYSPLTPHFSRDRQDACPTPKVLDFGIARTTDADLRTVTFGTSAGQIIGTLAYMSPEQVSGDPAQLDTRSDVYSLGVILYELLAGKLPHDVTTCSIAEAARKIRDEEPARLTGVRRSGDLEILAAKALAKDKARRYQSAAALGDDLRRYLSGDPIEARRDSPLSQWYLLRKAVARHRGAAVAALAFVVLLAASTVALAFMYGKQKRERERATAAATRAEAVSSFLENMLTSVDPQYNADSDVTVRQVLDRAMREIDNGSLAGQPELEAAMRGTLGMTYVNLGIYPEAEGLLENALEQKRRQFGERSDEAADALNHLGTLRHYQGRYAEAETLLNQALEIRRESAGRSDPGVGFVLQNLGAVYHALGDLDRAEARIREALAIRRAAGDPHHVAASLNSLAVIRNRQGNASEAEVLYREILAMDRQKWRGRLVPALDASNNLAFLLQSRGDFSGAESLYQESLVLARKVLGEAHPSVAIALNNLGALRRDMGDLAGAETAAREGLEIRRKTLPPEHPHLARSALLLGHIKLEQNQPAEAEPLLRECWEIRKKSMEPGHHLIAEAASVLGECLTSLGRYDEAEPLLVESYPVIRAGRGEQHERTQEALHRLVRHYEARGMPQRAGEIQRVLPAGEQR